MKSLLIISGFWVLFGYSFTVAAVNNRYRNADPAHSDELLIIMVGVLIFSLGCQVLIWKRISKRYPDTLSARKDIFLYSKQKTIGQRDLTTVYLVTYLALLLVAFCFYQNFSPENISAIWRANLPGGLVVIAFCTVFILNLNKELSVINEQLRNTVSNEN